MSDLDALRLLVGVLAIEAAIVFIASLGYHRQRWAEWLIILMSVTGLLALSYGVGWILIELERTWQ